MRRTDKYSQHSSIIWPAWLVRLLFVYKLNRFGFEFRSCHLENELFWFSDEELRY